MKLIKEWREWYKLWSVWIFALLGVYQWLMAHQDALNATLPPKGQAALGVLLSVLGIVSRLVVQVGLSKPK